MKQKECLLAALLLLPLTAMAALEASDLRVESLRTPLGIDTQTPAFSWLLNSDERGCTQVSYAIIVTKADGTQVWSSGTVPSNQHTGIAYAGSALESCSAYSWAVTLTDNRGRTTTCTSSFETAFMDASEWTGKWIYTEGITELSMRASYHVPYFGKNFLVTGDKTVSRARIYASALGVFTMTLNGQPVTDAVLEPGESEYERTILYSTYDVTDLVKSGENYLLARVAGGIYNIEYLAGRFSKGEVKNNGQTALLAELLIEYTDGTSERIITDDTWRTTPSPTKGSNWWGGEDYDAAFALMNDEQWIMDNWNAVSVLDSPLFTSPHSGVSGFGTLRSRMYEPLRVVEQWPAVSVKTITSGGYTLRMVDFGRNFAGQYRFRLKGRRGQTITLRCGESLNADGSVYMENYYTGPADTYDTYTFAGNEDGETWGPEFMYHGFRYLQIIGLDEEPSPCDFTAMRIRSDMEPVGSFTTSNSLVNDIHIICCDAIASQLYNSITDCPHREKLGWLDVPNEMFNSLNANFDMQTFYKKVVLDCFDAQKADGHVPSVAPYYMNVYGDDVNWGGAAILVPYRVWKFYGDKSLIIKYYTQMKALVTHYAANTTGGIINDSFSVLSDWGQETAGVSPMVPTGFTETTTYYYILRAMAEMATELGERADAEKYTSMAVSAKSAFNTKYYDAATGIYTSVSGGGGRQSEQAMPLYYGLVPDGDETKVAAVLANRVAADGYKIKSGEIALKPIFMSLARYGYNNIVWQMANQTDCPSYGYWVRQGYTTTPEYWDVGAFSQNHCMMDHIEEWFFSELAGIKTQDNSSIFNASTNTLHIQPYLPDDLNSLDVTQRMSAGHVRVAWQRLTDGYHFQLSIPAGAQATVILPTIVGKVLKENDTNIAAGRNGIVSVTYGMTETQVIMGSGDYDLTLGEGNVITAADGEIFRLPEHGVDELTTDNFQFSLVSALAQEYKMAGPYEVVARDGEFRSSKAGSERDMKAAWDFAREGKHDEALRIINAYAEKLQRIDGHDAPLCLIQGYWLCRAMMIEKKHKAPAWESMLRRAMVPTMEKFETDSPYANGNWGAIVNRFRMACALAIGDSAMYQAAIDYYLNGNDNGALPNYVSETGQCQETGRDQGHAQLGLEAMADICEMAWQQGERQRVGGPCPGIDLWAALDNRLMKGFEYTARYNLGYDVPFETWTDLTGLYCNWTEPGQMGRGKLWDIYQKTYDHYVKAKGLKMPYTEKVLALQAKAERKGESREVRVPGVKEGAKLHQVFTYPAPEGAPLKDDYDVYICPRGKEWIKIDTYMAKVNASTGNYKHKVSEISYCFFDFTGDVFVKVISKNKKFKSARIRPDYRGTIANVQNDSTVQFLLFQPENVSVELDGDITDNLLVFTSKPTISKKDAEKAAKAQGRDFRYYAPGIYTEDVIKVSSNTTVYLGGGSYFSGTFAIEDAENVSILGRGIARPASGYEGCHVHRSKNVLIDGIIVNTCPVGGSDGVTLHDVRSISHPGWGDGLNVFASSNVLFDRVFCRNSDDCTTAYATRKGFSGNTRNVRMRNSTLWADVAHPIFIGIHGNPEVGDTIEHLVYENIDILGQAEPQVDYQGCLAINCGDGNLVRDVLFDNIRIEQIEAGSIVQVKAGYNQKYCTAPGRSVEDVTFRNVRYTGTTPNLSIINGYDTDHGIRNVTFEGMKINGQLIYDEMPGKPRWYATADYVPMFVGNHVSGVVFTKNVACVMPRQR